MSKKISMKMMRLVPYTEETKVYAEPLQLVDYEKNIKGNLYATYNYINVAMFYILEHPWAKELTVTVKLNKNQELKIRLCEFVVHLILWLPEIRGGAKIDADDVYDIHNLSMKGLGDLLDARFYVRVSNGKTKHPLEINLGVIIDQLMFIMDNYAIAACASMSLFDLAKFYERSPEFREVIDFKFDVDAKMEIRKTEKILAEGAANIERIVMEDENNELYPYLASGEGVKRVQLCQLLFGIGTRTYAGGRIVPMLTSSAYINILGSSSNNINDVLCEGINARVALGLKSVYVKRSGHLSRRFNILCIDTEVDDLEDCGTKHLTRFEITSNNILKMINGKYYHLDPKDTSNKYHIIDAEKDKHLVGEIIYMRSSVTCIGEYGKICRTCYGTTATALRRTRLGYLPAINIVNPLSNLSMSYKHNSSTNSMSIDNEDFNKYFTIADGEYSLRSEYINMASILIQRSSVLINSGIDAHITEYYDSEEDTDEDETSADVINRIEMIINGEYLEIVILNGALVFTEEFSSYIKDTAGEPYADGDTHLKYELDPKMALFVPVLYSDGSSKFIHNINTLVDSTNFGITYQDYLAKFVGIIDSSRMCCNIGVIECIIYNLIRDKHNEYRRPDFRKKDPEYNVEPINSAIVTHRSPMVVLLLSNNVPVLANIQTFLQCTGYSIIEELVAPSHISLEEPFEDDRIAFRVSEDDVDEEIVKMLSLNG